jgi:hypothetical protein
MKDDIQYAVYFHDGALAALGEAITPYVTQGAHGPHIVCTELDTGGALCEMTVDAPNADGTVRKAEVMVPIAMIRLVLSLGSLDDHFGFHGVGPVKPAAGAAPE